MSYNPLNPNGQAAMAASQPVVIASNQSPVSVAGTLNIIGNPSVSGQLGASIIGTVPVTMAGAWTQSVVGTVFVGGSVATVGVAVANQSVSGTVGASIIGTVPVVQSGTNITSIVSGIPSSVLVGASIFGQLPAGTAVLGSVAALQSTNPWIVAVQSSVAVAIVSGSIAASFTPPANQSVSGTVNIGTGGPVSVMGTMSVLGTVPVTQATASNPWIITGSVQGSFSPAANQSVSGTVGASVIGTVPVVQSGTVISSISGAVQASVQGIVGISSLISIPAIVSTANSTATPVTSTLSFTGTGEEWKDFGSIVVNVFTDASSGTDGLSIQQSSDNTNWDIRDTYTITSMASGGGKTFQVQPAARFGRVVYTQGPVNSGAFRLQTIYHPQMVKPTSQRAQDGYSNETDLEQTQGFNMYLNPSGTWDRFRGDSTSGLKIYGSVIGVETFTNSSILAVPVGSVITVLQAPSIVGTYAEDAASASGDKGFLVMGARNDTLSSVTSADGDYSSHVVGPAGELIAANAPFTKWVQAKASVFTGITQPVITPQGSSVFTYVTAMQIANTSANNVLVTLSSGNSVIGYTIAPANGGSNIYYPNALKTFANADFGASISGVASVYVTAEGFVAKV